jgi:hypothetical protein
MCPVYPLHKLAQGRTAWKAVEPHTAMHSSFLVPGRCAMWHQPSQLVFHNISPSPIINVNRRTNRVLLSDVTSQSTVDDYIGQEIHYSPAAVARQEATAAEAA